VEGYLYSNEQVWGKAEAELERAVQLEPNNADGLFQLARAYQQDNKIYEARQMFQRATEVDPEYFRAWQNIAAFQLARSEYDSAAANFKKAVDLEPDNMYMLGILGFVCTELGNYAPSEQKLRRAIESDESVSARFWLGQTLIYERRYGAAIGELQRASQLLDLHYPPRGTPKEQVLMYLGIAYQLNDQLAQAAEANRDGLSAARRARETSHDASSNAMLAYFDAVLGNSSEALDQIANAAYLMESSATVRWRAVLTYEELYCKLRKQIFRDKSLQTLTYAPPQEVADFSRWPGLTDLQKDPEFVQMLRSVPLQSKSGENACAH
jgi:tetratricopeptide (TPR) repeat protein